MHYGIQGECARCQIAGIVDGRSWLCQPCIHDVERAAALRDSGVQVSSMDEKALDLISIYIERGDKDNALRVLRSYGYDRIRGRGLAIEN